MKEYTFICPHCGKAVEVDENGYVMDCVTAEQIAVVETEREVA